MARSMLIIKIPIIQKEDQELRIQISFRRILNGSLLGYLPIKGKTLNFCLEFAYKRPMAYKSRNSSCLPNV